MGGKKNKNKSNAAGGSAPGFATGPPPGLSSQVQVAPGQSAWGPQLSQQAQFPPGFRNQSQAAPIPQQSAWGPQVSQAQQAPKVSQAQQAPKVSQSQQAPQNEHQEAPLQQEPKKKGGGSKNKYPKKVVEPVPPSEPVASSSNIDLSKQMQQMNLSQSKTVRSIESSPDGRAYEGKKGQVCKLEVNYLQIGVKNMIPKAFHYDVTFTPDIPKKMLPKALDTFMETYFKGIHFAYDGRKSFYTNKHLSVKGVVLDGTFEQEVEAVLQDRRKNFKVAVQFAAEVDLTVLKNYTHPSYQFNDKPMRAIQCLDIILRTVFKQLTFNNRAVAVGRALYFAEQGRPLDLGEGMELWLGLFQSAILGRRSLFLNVDVAHKAFPSAISLLDVLKSFSRDGRLPNELRPGDQNKLTEYLKMLSISYQPAKNVAPKTFGFNGLVESARKAMFVDENNVRMSVLQYFVKKGIKLNFPDLPCLHVGSKIRNIYLPLEFCSVPAGQATNKKCTPNCVAQMIKYSATSSDVRKQKIRSLLDRVDYAQGNEIKGFGIDVDKTFQNVEGRVIQAPSIQYVDGVDKPVSGVWRGKKFLETQQEQIKWAILNCDDRTSRQAVVELSNNIHRESQRQGMGLAKASAQDIGELNFFRQGRVDDVVAVLDKLSKNGYKLVFVIIVDMNDCYAKVKQAAELRVGILTQCIKANTIFRMGKGNPMMTIGNIMLKVNAKLNGANHAVVETSYQLLNAPNSGIMFVGGDVTHPSPDQKDIPSVVGVAASYDSIGYRYQCAWRIQDPKKEMIVDLENILVDQLQFYLKHNKKLPGKIMYYRDGVSDGQFEEVLQVEMSAIRKAMTRMYKTNPPAKVTFVIVQKRHHTRFFPTDARFSDGRNNNIKPGTVVDKDIVHPFQYQFFLASHAAIQGVTKPSKYCVLVNESKIPPDDLQAITYDLCHLFTRCNRSVSYPAPTYYAHLVAARGKSYTMGPRLNMQNLQGEFERRVIQPNIVNNCPMFFV